MKKMLMTSYLSKRKLPINLSEVDISIFEHELSSQIEEVYYLKEKNVRVFNGILFSFRKLTFFMEHTFFKHLRTMYEKTFFERLKRILKGFIISRKSKEKLDKGIWFTDHKSHIYFHWILDSLQRAQVSSVLNKDYPLLVPEDFYNKQFVVESLDLLGFNYVIIKSNTIYKVKDLIIISKTAVSGNYYESILSELIQNFKSESKKIKNDKYENLFIKRSGKNGREISNIDELEKILEKHNFHFIEFEKYSFIEKIRILHSCKNLVGVFGSGLTNMIFLNPNSNILEIRNPQDKHNNAYFSLASALDLNYYYLYFDHNENVETLDVKKLNIQIEALDHILERLN